MANDDGEFLSKEQVHAWSYFSDLADFSHPFNFYQRKYPRRLPKLDNCSSLYNHQISSDEEKYPCNGKKLEKSHTMPSLSPIAHNQVELSNEKVLPLYSNANEYVSKMMVLEDIQDEHFVASTAVGEGIEVSNSVPRLKLSSKDSSFSQPMPMLDVATDFKKKSFEEGLSCKHRPTSSIQSGSIKLRNNQSVETLSYSTIRPKLINNCPTVVNLPRKTSNSKKKKDEGLKNVSPIVSIPGRKSQYNGFDPPMINRSQSTGENQLKNKRNIHSSLSKQLSKQSESGNLNLVTLLQKQKESKCIKSLTKSEIVKIERKCDTYDLSTNNQEVSDVRKESLVTQLEKTVCFMDKEPNISLQNCVTKITPENLVSDMPEKHSREFFFNNPLEVDLQMKSMDTTTETFSQVIHGEQLKGEPISAHVALTLRMLLFGSGSASFTTSWREQGISFVKEAHYGLSFSKDGPVEIMTSLQAYVLKNLLFQNKDRREFDPRLLTPDSSAQTYVLVLSISDMLWKIGRKTRAIVTLPIGKNTQFTSGYNYKDDQITEKMELFKFTTFKDLKLFIMQNICHFIMPKNKGCISLLYSLMLTRGLLNLYLDCCERKVGILESIDVPGRSQSLINLCIYGEGIPNVFNNDVEIYNDEKDLIEIKKGLQKRSEIGYLAYFECFGQNNQSVGSCMKTPQFPIWILNNETTLGVLFSTKRNLLNDWKLERRFDLYYYQGITKHIPTTQLDICLTMNTMEPFVLQCDDEEDRSTLEETLRTKWKDCVIYWNGFTRF